MHKRRSYYQQVLAEKNQQLRNAADLAAIAANADKSEPALEDQLALLGSGSQSSGSGGAKTPTAKSPANWNIFKRTPPARRTSISHQDLLSVFRKKPTPGRHKAPRLSAPIISKQPPVAKMKEPRLTASPRRRQKMAEKEAQDNQERAIKTRLTAFSLPLDHADVDEIPDHEIDLNARVDVAGMQIGHAPLRRMDSDEHLHYKLEVSTNAQSCLYNVTTTSTCHYASRFYNNRRLPFSELLKNCSLSAKPVELVKLTVYPPAREEVCCNPLFHRATHTSRPGR